MDSDSHMQHLHLKLLTNVDWHVCVIFNVVENGCPFFFDYECHLIGTRHWLLGKDVSSHSLV